MHFSPDYVDQIKWVHSKDQLLGNLLWALFSHCLVSTPLHPKWACPQTCEVCCWEVHTSPILKSTAYCQYLDNFKCMFEFKSAHLKSGICIYKNPTENWQYAASLQRTLWGAAIFSLVEKFFFLGVTKKQLLWKRGPPLFRVCPYLSMSLTRGSN